MSTSASQDLPADEVHAWSFGLDQPAKRRDELSPLLDDAERSRASRFVFDTDRDRFVVGRGTLRRLLGGYTGVDPARLVFAVGPEGKPALAGPRQSRLHFNFSNSQDRALFAVARRGPVGADLEVHRPLPELEALARHHFSPAEMAVLLALPEDDREAAFYRCWTRKEAFVKALGSGLTIPLGDFEVEFRPSAPAKLLGIRSSARAARRWTLWDVDAGTGVSAAVIVRATAVALRLFTVD